YFGISSVSTSGSVAIRSLPLLDDGREFRVRHVFGAFDPGGRGLRDELGAVGAVVVVLAGVRIGVALRAQAIGDLLLGAGLRDSRFLGELAQLLDAEVAELVLDVGVGRRLRRDGWRCRGGRR